MKQVIIIVTILYSLVSFTACQRLRDWETIMLFILLSATTAYPWHCPRVLAIHKELKQDRKQYTGTVDVIYYTSENTRGAVLIMFNPLPDHAFQNKEPEELLTEQEKSIIRSSNGVLDSSRVYFKDSLAIRSIFYTADIGGKSISIRNDCFVKKPKMYQVSFGAYKKQELEESDILRYFNSITLKN